MVSATGSIREQMKELLVPYKGERGALIPILQKTQEKLGYLPEEAVEEIAKFLHITRNQIFGVMTFYAQFRLAPTGKNVVRVCRGTACHVKGGHRILLEVEKRLGVKEGQTTPDLNYTLETVACIGACALAPTMVINEETHGEMTMKKVEELFGDVSKGDRHA